MSGTLFAQLPPALLTGMPAAVLIDGRTGSGKTTLANELADHFGADMLHLEDLYPGWDGLAEGSRAVAAVLRAGRYRRYDWHEERFAEWIELDLHRPLIIEGCGSITRENLAAAAELPLAAGAIEVVRTVWIHCPEPVRRSRALARDGESFAPHWERWAAQEDAHYAAGHETLVPETGTLVSC